tara:strand:+ start:48340 stop:48981 length:642 start_codon:yes stop_codon:yes gene_type:complete
MKFILKSGLIALLAASLGGCALTDIANGPAPQLYMLTASSAVAASDSIVRSKSGILVDQLNANAALDTARVAYQPVPNELKYIAGARWVDLAPLMLQSLLVESLENSGRFASVAARGSEIRGDFMVKGDMRQFAVVNVDGETHVEIDLYLRLVSRENRQVIVARDFRRIVPVDGSGMTPIVAAFDVALGQVLLDVTQWVVEGTNATAVVAQAE